MSDAARDGESAPAPLVSIILTCFNHQEFLVQALEGVRAQSYRPLQLIVTDDASADDSADRIASWLAANWPDAVFIRHERNRGLCRTLNEALGEATGEYVSISSSDDWMEPGRIERLVEEFAGAPDEVGLVYSGVRVVDEDGTEVALVHVEPGSLPSGQIFAQQLALPLIPTPTVLLRRSVFDEVGGYNEDDPLEDYDMWLRVCRRYHARHVPAALVNFRWHQHNTTSQVHGDVYDTYIASCLRRQLGASIETDELIHRQLAELAANAASRSAGSNP
jgi:glycosyltransferase involved in cell wall biosynthesis